MKAKLNRFIVFLLLIILTNCINVEKVNAEHVKWTCYYASEGLMVRSFLRNYAGGFLGFTGYNENEIDYFGGPISPNTEDFRNYFYDFNTDSHYFKTKEDRTTYGLKKYTTASEAKNNPYKCPAYIVGTSYQHDLFAFEKKEDAVKFVNYVNDKSKTKYVAYLAKEVTKKEYFFHYEEASNINGKIETVEDCTFIDEDVRELITDFLKYVAIIVPIGIIGISSYELAKALAKGKEDEMKKAQKHLVIRIAVSILIFLTPTIVNVIFSVTESIWIDSGLYTCDIYGNEVGGSSSACYVCGEAYYWGLESVYGDCTKTNYTRENCPAD